MCFFYLWLCKLEALMPRLMRLFCFPFTDLAPGDTTVVTLSSGRLESSVTLSPGLELNLLPVRESLGLSGCS